MWGVSRTEECAAATATISRHGSPLLPPRRHIKSILHGSEPGGTVRPSERAAPSQGEVGARGEAGPEPLEPFAQLGVEHLRRRLRVRPRLARRGRRVSGRAGAGAWSLVEGRIRVSGDSPPSGRVANQKVGSGAFREWVRGH